MRLRVLIFEDKPSIRKILWMLGDRRGYEVLTFSDPALCPFHGKPPYPCPRSTVCADLLLVDLRMPEVPGLDFVEALVARGCPAPQIALMPGAWAPAEHARAVRLGCRLFRKPFAIAELLAWFAAVEARVAPTRALLDWWAPRWRTARSAPGAGL